MLDNNEFFFAAAGWTCHCDACTKAFREYVQKRFGNDKVQETIRRRTRQTSNPNRRRPALLRMAPLAKPRLGRGERIVPRPPPQAKPEHHVLRQHAIRLRKRHARHRPAIRARRRRPQRIVRTEFPPDVGKDGPGKRRRRTAVRSGTTSARSPRADDYTGLRPPEAVGPAIAATLAHNARPWIVDGFDEGPTNPRSRELMSKLLAWQARHRGLFAGKPLAGRHDHLDRIAQRPSHAAHPATFAGAAIRRRSIVGLLDDALTSEQLQPFKVVTVETAECLPEKAAAALAGWVRSGGTLLMTPGNRLLRRNWPQTHRAVALEGLQLSGTPDKPTTVGAGQVPRRRAGSVRERGDSNHATLFVPEKRDSGVEVVAYRSGRIGAASCYPTRSQPWTDRTAFAENAYRNWAGCDAHTRFRRRANSVD